MSNPNYPQGDSPRMIIVRLFAGGLWGFADAAIFGVIVSCAAIIYCGLEGLSIQHMQARLTDTVGGTLIFLGWILIGLCLAIRGWILPHNDEVMGFVGSLANPSTPIRLVFAIMLLAPSPDGSVIQKIIIAPSIRFLSIVLF